MLPAAGLYAGEEMEIEFRVVDVEHPDGSGAPSPLLWGQLLGEVSMPSMHSMPGFSEIAHREGVPGCSVCTRPSPTAGTTDCA